MNAFNIEMIKGFTRTTSANRVSAVQMIALGSGIECKANAYAAFTTTKELVGVDKGTVSLYKALSEMPESIWAKFTLACKETPEGVKQANLLIKLAQAFEICAAAGVGFKDGFAAGQEAGQEALATTTATTPTTAAEEG